MDQKLFERYPAIVDLQNKAKKRIPHFAWEYLNSGTGIEDCLDRNRQAFSKVILVPQFMQGEFEPEINNSLFGIEYSAPFGIAPVGLTGLMWPGAEKILARTAAKARIPFSLSTVATETPELIGPLSNGMGWFQLYPPRREALRQNLLKRAQDSGFTTLLITADVPIGSRRERQIRAGVNVPPKITLRTLYHSTIRPSWTLATLGHGQPRFKTLEKYLDAKDMQNMVSYVGKELGGTLDWPYVEAVRKEWNGPIVLKGLLETSQAEQAVDVGVDGIFVSNHGGRQFDGAPAALDVLPAMKSAVGNKIKILFDSGVRTGLDIARALALGADFVLLGSAFMYGVAALGERGGDHVVDILTEDLKNNMKQLGCRELKEIQNRLRQ
ncbi:MAG: alpha-hydroxy acid oxidase [Desulfobacterales bacterium]|nr:alpha-hydroxy acid oxidase [Desulfobacterales bacterium]